MEIKKALWTILLPHYNLYAINYQNHDSFKTLIDK